MIDCVKLVVVIGVEFNVGFICVCFKNFKYEYECGEFNNVVYDGWYVC